MKYSKSHYAWAAFGKLFLITAGGVAMWASFGDAPPGTYDAPTMIFGIICVLVGLLSGWEEW